MEDLINTNPYLLFFGCLFIVMGLSAFFAAPAWKEYLVLLSKSRALLLIGGIINLPIGLFILMFFKSWDTPAEMLLMAVGVVSLLKAILLMTKPELIQKLLAEEKLVFKPFWIHGVVGIVIGVGLLVL